MKWLEFGIRIWKNEENNFEIFIFAWCFDAVFDHVVTLITRRYTTYQRYWPLGSRLLVASSTKNWSIFAVIIYYCASLFLFICLFIVCLFASFFVRMTRKISYSRKSAINNEVVRDWETEGCIPSNSSLSNNFENTTTTGGKRQNKHHATSISCWL